MQQEPSPVGFYPLYPCLDSFSFLLLLLQLVFKIRSWVLQIMLYSSFPILTYHGRRHVVSRKVSQVPTFGHFLGLLSTYNVANERYRINLFRQPCQSTIGRDWPDMDEKLRFRDQLWVYLWKEDMIVFTVIVFVTGLSSGEPRHTAV